MAQIRKMDCQVEIKSPAYEFYDAFKTKAQLMPKMANQVITDIKLLQGDWDSVGAVRLWTYIAGDKSETIKEKLVHVDDKNKTLVFRMLEGDVLNSYKSWNTILNITPMGEGTMVKWTMEFEKQIENIADPVKYADFFTIWTKNVDAYLLNA
ncbi:hypothetical protein CRYUN_Cryun21dG0042500 [Craigia yunnanensis]